MADRGSVLLIDDEPLVLRAYARALQQAGINVYPVADSDLVPELLDRGGFDAVICDVSMPGLDGPEVLRAARARDPDLPVVLMSGAAIQVDTTGVLRCLRKPMDLDVLKRTAREAIALRRLALLERQAYERYGREAADAPLPPQPIVSLSARAVVGVSWRPCASPVATQGGMVVACLRPDELGAVELPHAAQLFLALDEREVLAQAPSLRVRLAGFVAAGRLAALDAVGAGPASLSVLAAIEPRLIRLHPALVGGLDGDGDKHGLVAALAAACKELGITMIAPGVTSAGERDALAAAGCDLVQASDPQLLL